ncbi:MAG: hypothetical protein QOF32_1262 [Gammaproteobacteria bacterium]|jgi:hypothetical protein|nr:hypothetical protein [Gammaproteobacteria bacterium]
MNKFLLSILALSTSTLCFAATPLDLGSVSGATPYDRYMQPVKNVLTHLSGDDASLDKVRDLMHIGRNFRYSFTDPYVAATPERTAAIRAGDCKAKALWLADQLNDESVRFVIGKARSSSRISHAWLMWQHDSRWWILDCTNNREPVPADRVSSSQYIPFYSYAKNATYRHHSTESSMAAVAHRSNAPVAAAK